MSKKLMMALAVAAMSVFMGMTAFAGSWQNDNTGWWWQNDDGGYPTDTWQWIDGNGDGVSECYYFDGNGYCLMNTETPDGYTVNADGAWTANGTVQTQGAQTQSQTQAGNQGLVNVNIRGFYVDPNAGDTIMIRDEAGALVLSYMTETEEGMDGFLTVLTKIDDATYQGDDYGRVITIKVIDNQTIEYNDETTPRVFTRS